MKKYLQILLVTLLLFSSTVALPVAADLNTDIQNSQTQIEKNRAEQERLKRAIEDARGQERTLANQIKYLNNQISLTELQMAETEEGIGTKEEELTSLQELIANVSVKIDETKTSIAELTNALQSRVRSSYKTSQTMQGPTLPVLINGVNNIQELVTRYKYFKVVELHDKKILDELEVTKAGLVTQKDDLENKKKEVENLKIELEQERSLLEANTKVLGEQKYNKDYLLRITQNDEAQYQDTLNAILAEQQSLQNGLNQLLSQIRNPGNGAQVKRGEVIGIQGRSGMATGEHLHLGVYSYTEKDFINGNYSLCSRHLDPAPYLNSGEFAWPVNPALGLIPSLPDFNANDDYYCSQGVCQVYGRTNFAQAYAWIYCPYGFHNGIDMNGSAGTPVYAAADGVAYTIRLGDVQGNGVFIFHPNGLMTIYWHLR